MRDETRKKILGKVAKESGNGRIWRAKETLQSNVQYYDEELYLRYAEILEKMGDNVEAGKYYLLSNKFDAPYNELIRLFLNRHGKNCLNNVISQFPKCMQSSDIESYSQRIAEPLKALKVPYFEKNTRQGLSQTITAKDKFDWFGLLLTTILLAWMGFGIVGVVVTIKWIFD